VPGADPLTLQTVEVVSDSREGRALVSVGKGDFRVSKTPSTGELGVLEVRASPALPLHPHLCTSPLRLAPAPRPCASPLSPPFRLLLTPPLRLPAPRPRLLPPFSSLPPSPRTLQSVQI
jgi:hypothetical protein